MPFCVKFCQNGGCKVQYGIILYVGDRVILFIKSLPRLIRSANKDMHRHFSMTFSSIVSIGIALLMSLFMFVIYMNVGQFTNQIEEGFMIQVSINPTLNQDEVDALEKKIESLSNVKSVTYSSKDDELDALIQENGEMFKQYKGENNPLYDVFEVELKDNSGIQKVTKKINSMSGVVEATYGGSSISILVKLFKNIRIWGSVFVGLMIFIALFLIRSTIKMTILVRKDEIWIMRTVGAYNWYISFPFVLEGMFIGFWGALGPILICVFGYTALYHIMDGMFFSNMMTMLNPYPFVLWTSLAILAIGMLVGMLGSYLAVRKYVRWTR